MKEYEKPKIGLIVWQQEDVLTASGENEKSSDLKAWFGDYFNQ